MKGVGAKSKTHLQGAGGVFAVCAQLCFLGHTPCLPIVDDGVDVFLDNGLKLQIKSGRLRHGHPNYPFGAYCFDARRGWKRKGHEIINNSRERNYAGQADFVIFYAVDEHRFFIMPPHEIDQTFWIQPKSRKTKLRIYDFEDAWHLLDMNAALEEVEERQEVSTVNAEV